MKLVLASGSSARRQMLEQAGYEFDIVPSGIDEQLIKNASRNDQTPAHELALALAKAKAEDVALRMPGRLVVGSDQILEINGKTLSKVRTLADAARQLAMLSGKTHKLHSAVACYRGATCEFSAVDTAKLTMFPLSPEQINAYINQVGDSILGSVGCYQIEGKGIRLFETIEGSHFTIMGMPLLQLSGYIRTLAPDAGDF